MSQAYCLEMNEDQRLLDSTAKISQQPDRVLQQQAKLNISETQIQTGSSHSQQQVNHQVIAQNNPPLQPPLANNPNPANQFSIPKKYSIILDYLIASIYLSKAIVFGDLSQFGKFWIIGLLVFKIYKGFSTFVPRFFILITSIFLLFLFYSEGLNVQMKIFFAIYSIQLIPGFLKLCCFACCMCTCATCCLCGLVVGLISQYSRRRMDKQKYSKVRQQLSNRNIDVVVDRQCPICLETGNQMNNQQCHHSFHPKCLKQWIENHKTCPVCRHQLY